MIEDTTIKAQGMNLADLSIEIFQELDISKPSKEASTGVVLFLMAFIGAVLNLPSFLLVGGESICQKIIWRYFGLLVFISPRFLYDFLSATDALGKAFFSNIIPIFFLAILNTIYVYLVYFAVKHTFVAHTLLLCSIGTTFLATWKIARRAQYTTIEYIGVGVNVFGAYLCLCEGAPIPRIFP